MKPNFVAERADTPSPGTEPQSWTGYSSDLGLGLTAHTLSGANGGSTDAWLVVREPAGTSLLPPGYSASKLLRTSSVTHNMRGNQLAGESREYL